MAFFSLEVFQIGTVIIWILDHKQVGTELDIANTPAGRKLASLTGLKYSMYSISAMNLAMRTVVDRFTRRTYLATELLDTYMLLLRSFTLRLLQLKQEKKANNVEYIDQVTNFYAIASK